MKKAAAAYAIAVLVVGLIVTAVMARETPEEKQAKQQAAAAAPKPYPAEMTPADEVAARVQRLRGRRFDGAVPKVEILREQELGKRLTKAQSAAAQELQKQGGEKALTEATGIVLAQAAAVRPPDVAQATQQFGGPEVLGAYLPSERTIVVGQRLVRSDPRMAEQVIAHEMARALENPRSGGHRAVPFHDEHSAQLAVEEGAATVVEREYAARHLGVRRPVAPVAADLREDRTESDTPPALRTYARFPSGVGGPVVSELHERGGWRAVENAVRAAPLSTRDLLHPAAAGTADDVTPPRPAIAEALGKGWKRMAGGEVGELDVLAMLSAAGERRPAVRGAEGWIAGTFETWTRGGKAAQSCKPPCRRQSASAVVVRWEDPQDAIEYGRATRTVLEQTAGAERAGGRAWTIDDGGAALVRAGRFTALVFAPDAPSAGKVAEAALRP